MKRLDPSPQLRAVIVDQDHAMLRILLRSQPDGPRDAETIAKTITAIRERLKHNMCGCDECRTATAVSP